MVQVLDRRWDKGHPGSARMENPGYFLKVPVTPNPTSVGTFFASVYTLFSLLQGMKWPSLLWTARKSKTILNNTGDSLSLFSPAELRKVLQDLCSEKRNRACLWIVLTPRFYLISNSEPNQKKIHPKKTTQWSQIASFMSCWAFLAHL